MDTPRTMNEEAAWRRARGAPSGADAASGREGRPSGRIARHQRTRAPGWSVPQTTAAAPDACVDVARFSKSL
jgi:hypothetical protein